MASRTPNCQAPLPPIDPHPVMFPPDAMPADNDEDLAFERHDIELTHAFTTLRWLGVEDRHQSMVWEPTAHCDQAEFWLRGSDRGPTMAALGCAFAATELFALASGAKWAAFVTGHEGHPDERIAENVDGLGWSTAIDWAGFPRRRGVRTLVRELRQAGRNMRPLAAKLDPEDATGRVPDELFVGAANWAMNALAAAVALDATIFDDGLWPEPAVPRDR